MVDINQILRGKAGGVGDPPAKRGRKPKGDAGTVDGSGDANQRVENVADASGGEALSGGTVESGQESPQSVAPETAIGDATGKPERKKRGPNKSKAETGPNLGIDAKQLAPQIQGLHAMLALMTGQPVFNLSQGECEMLANNIANVSQHYNIAPSSKAMAIAGLVACCGMIYVPRVAMIRRARPKEVESPIFPATPEAATATPKNGRYDFSGDTGAGNMAH